MDVPRRGRALTLEDIVDRVRREFAALPGLKLNEAQIRRMWGLEPTVCHRVLTQLTDDHFLMKNGAGQYARALRSAERRGPRVRR